MISHSYVKLPEGTNGDLMDSNENLVESSSQKSEIWVSFDKEGEDQREISVEISVLKMGQFFWEDDQDQHSRDTVDSIITLNQKKPLMMNPTPRGFFLYTCYEHLIIPR